MFSPGPPLALPGGLQPVPTAARQTLTLSLWRPSSRNPTHYLQGARSRRSQVRTISGLDGGSSLLAHLLTSPAPSHLPAQCIPSTTATGCDFPKERPRGLRAGGRLGPSAFKAPVDILRNHLVALRGELSLLPRQPCPRFWSGSPQRLTPRPCPPHSEPHTVLKIRSFP